MFGNFVMTTGDGFANADDYLRPVVCMSNSKFKEKYEVTLTDE